MMNDERVALPPDPKRRVRLRRSEKTWRGIFTRQRSSGMTVEEFCLAEGIGRSTFNRWQMRLQSRDSLAGRARSAQADTVPSPESGDRFIDAEVLYGDRSGFCIWGKRLERGRFVSDWSKMRSTDLDWMQLKMMLDGIIESRRKLRYSVPINARKAA